MSILIQFLIVVLVVGILYAVYFHNQKTIHHTIDTLKPKNDHNHHDSSPHGHH